MSNAIKDEKEWKAQERKYIVAKELLNALFVKDKKYLPEVYEELKLCEEKVNSLEPVYFEIKNEVIVKGVDKTRINLRFKEERKMNLNLQASVLLDFLIRYPEKRKFNYLYYFFVSTKEQIKNKNKVKNLNRSFGVLITQLLKSLEQAKIPIFTHDKGSYKQSSTERIIKDGKKLYYSNIKEGHNYYIQALKSFDEKEYENAFKIAGDAIGKDERNIDACLLISRIVSNEMNKLVIDERKLITLLNRISGVLEDEEKRYSYMIENVLKMRPLIKRKKIYVKTFLSEFSSKLHKIKKSLVEIEQLLPDDKHLRTRYPSNIKSDNSDQKTLYNIVKIISKYKSQKYQDEIFMFLTHPIVIESMEDLALEKIGEKFSDKTKNKLEDEIANMESLLMLELQNKKNEFKQLCVDNDSIRNFLRKIIMQSSWKDNKEKKHLVKGDFETILEIDSLAKWQNRDK